MNKPELQVKQQLEFEGWKVLRGGAPDYIALKVDDGQILDVKGVEVKSKGGKLTYEQSIYKMVFERAGIPYEVVIPDQINPSQTGPDQTKPSLSNPSLTFPNLTTPNLTSPTLTSPFQANPNQFFKEES